MGPTVPNIASITLAMRRRVSSLTSALTQAASLSGETITTERASTLERRSCQRYAGRFRSRTRVPCYLRERVRPRGARAAGLARACDASSGTQRCRPAYCFGYDAPCPRGLRKRSIYETDVGGINNPSRLHHSGAFGHVGRVAGRSCFLQEFLQAAGEDVPAVLMAHRDRYQSAARFCRDWMALTALDRSRLCGKRREVSAKWPFPLEVIVRPVPFRGVLAASSLSPRLENKGHGRSNSLYAALCNPHRAFRRVRRVLCSLFDCPGVVDNNVACHRHCCTSFRVPAQGTRWDGRPPTRMRGTATW